MLFLLEHLPSGLRMVLASRSDPPLPLARLRAGGQLAELGALLGRLVAAHRAKQAPARRIPLRCLARLVQAFDGKPNAAAAPRPELGTVPGLIEPLTGRELEVLRLLAAGRSNQRIAHDLVVALDTVKKHVTHVLGKLGAANRTEAVARARDLGLIH